MTTNPIYQRIAAMGHQEGRPSYQQLHSASSPMSFGKPGCKPRLALVDLLALLLSVACLIAAVCTISPRLNLAWYLGYNSQLIVIGFLLSVMNLCLGTVSPALLFMIEARFGQSTLQNYEAILRNQPLSTKPVSLLWRTILLMFIALPLGLSAGYKRYSGGAARTLIPERNVLSNMYGTTALPGLNDLGSSVGYAELINASLPFISASRDDRAFPTTFPQPYGQNTLLISNTTTAILDLPMPDLVTSLQQSLVTGETKTVSATVHAFVTTYNQSVQQHRDDTAYWNQYVNGDYTLNVVDMYTGYQVYTLMNNFFGDDASWCFVAVCQSDADFIRTALRFDTSRHSCRATWDISTNSMNLVRASCDVEPLPPSSQEVLTKSILAIGIWYTPILADNIGSITIMPGTPWLLPTYVTTLATMYWARISALLGPSSHDSIQAVANSTYTNVELYYSADDQIVWSTKPSVDAKWSLYGILVLQPLLTVIVLISKTFFHSVPVGEGFGLVTILAGANKEALNSLEGASLTGELTRPVRIAIGVRDEPHARLMDEQEIAQKAPLQHVGRIEFVVNGQERNGQLTKEKVYT